MKRIIIFTLLLGCFTFGSTAQVLKKEIIKLSDAPAENSIKNKGKENIAFSEMLKQWKGIEDINKWIGENFHYDISRAVALGSKRNEGPKIGIFSPEEMFINKSGICVDLSRFAFETLKQIVPETEIHYLMIDFEPIEIQGSIIRKHWVVAYKNNGKFYVTADSKRPGFIDGPYENVQEFIDKYETFRERKIESFKLLNDYKKTQKKKLAKTQRKGQNENQKLKGQ